VRLLTARSPVQVWSRALFIIIMEITKELTQTVSKAAKLSLTDEELTKFTQDLKEILNAFKILDEINTDNTKSSFRPIEQKNSVREDVEKECLPQKETLKFTQHKRDGFFIGPKTVE
jgi:aspartyl-tRNA(Asn)/glutamyl-tRNA(Gln) amidotransferase subunit C